MKKALFTATLLVTTSASAEPNKLVLDCFINEPTNSLSKKFKDANRFSDLRIEENKEERAYYLYIDGKTPNTKNDWGSTREDRSSKKGSATTVDKSLIFDIASAKLGGSLILDVSKNYGSELTGDLKFRATESKGDDVYVQTFTKLASGVICKPEKLAFGVSERNLLKVVYTVEFGNGGGAVTPIDGSGTSYTDFKKSAEYGDCTIATTKNKAESLKALGEEADGVSDLLKGLNVTEAYSAYWDPAGNDEDSESCLVRRYVVKTADGYELNLDVDLTD